MAGEVFAYLMSSAVYKTNIPQLQKEYKRADPGGAEGGSSGGQDPFLVKSQTS